MYEYLFFRIIRIMRNQKLFHSLRTSSPKGFDHYRIETNAGSYFIEPEYTFPDLKSLILRYQEEKQPVLAAEILYPLLTSKNFQSRYSSTLFSDDDFTLSGRALRCLMITSIKNSIKIFSEYTSPVVSY